MSRNGFNDHSLNQSENNFFIYIYIYSGVNNQNYCKVYKSANSRKIVETQKCRNRVDDDADTTVARGAFQMSAASTAKDGNSEVKIHENDPHHHASCVYTTRRNK